MPPKRRSNGDEVSHTVDHTPRKRSRLQHVESADEQSDADIYDVDEAHDATPTKPRSARPLNKKSQRLESVAEEDEKDEVPTPKPKRRTPRSANGRKAASPEVVGEDDAEEEERQTPYRRGRKTATPKKASAGKTVVATPIRPKLSALKADNRSRNAADRSARRKSTRTLIERTIAGEVSDDEEDEEVAREICGDEIEPVDEDVGLKAPLPDLHDDGLVPDTPSKKTPKGTGKTRGRPKGTKNKVRDPSPPRDLPPPELYFAQNMGAVKISNHTLSSLALLDHDEYFTLLRTYSDPHQESVDFLESLHARSFSQWDFELREGFNICSYGWGSKRKLLNEYAEHVYARQGAQKSKETPKIVVVNGYNHSTTLRSLLTTLQSILPNLPKSKGTSGQPFEIADNILEHLSSPSQSETVITLIIHSLDAPPLRRQATQSLIARLASHPCIRLVASTDHPNAALLWDSGIRSSFNFVWHDTTTFSPYEVERPTVDEVHSLLGRSGRRVGGKEGVGFVLRSLPVNARSLFKILIMEQLMALEEAGGDEGEGVEYRTLYQKAVGDFVCGDEVAFRSLLKEFHDHQMVVSRKDAMGMEMLAIPFRKEELETILEDLMA